jgi:hypothetical protein
MKSTILATLAFVALSLGASAQVRGTISTTPIQRNLFRATAITLVCTSESRQKYNAEGLCNPIFTFNSAVTSNGQGTLVVELLVDGVVKQKTSLSFAKGETKTVAFTYDASNNGAWGYIYQATFCVRATVPGGASIEKCGYHVRSCIQ